MNIWYQADGWQIGYVERARNITYPNGMPDSMITTNLLSNGEIIIILIPRMILIADENPYDPNSRDKIEFTEDVFFPS